MIRERLGMEKYMLGPRWSDILSRKLELHLFTELHLFVVCVVTGRGDCRCRRKRYVPISQVCVSEMSCYVHAVCPFMFSTRFF